MFMQPMHGRTMIQTQASTRTPFSGSSALRRAAACSALLHAGPDAVNEVLCSVRRLAVALHSAAASPIAMQIDLHGGTAWQIAVCTAMCGGHDWLQMSLSSIATNAPSQSLVETVSIVQEPDEGLQQQWRKGILTYHTCT